MMRPGLAAAALLAAIAPLLPSCGSACGLALAGRTNVQLTVECCGNAAFKDVPVAGTSAAEYDLSNVLSPSQAGVVDAFLVPTSCSKLVDGPYPGSPLLCQPLIGATAPGKVSTREKSREGGTGTS